MGFKYKIHDQKEFSHATFATGLSATYPQPASYVYDRIGNTTKDLISGQDTIKWNLYNKVVYTKSSDSLTQMKFKYDGAGNRVAKFVIDKDIVSENDYYVHDAQGNILATYHEKRDLFLPANLNKRTFSLSGHNIYGSSRLGVKNYWPLQIGQSWDYFYNVYDTVRLWKRVPWYSLEYQDVIKDTAQDAYANTFTDKQVTAHLTGQKQYEITDHLGDVLATLSDARLSNGVPGDTLRIADYEPVVNSMNDYYPFGMIMPGRSFEDNNIHTTSVTGTMMMPVYDSVVIPWGDGNAVITGTGGTIVNGPPLVLTAPLNGGLSYTLHHISGGVNQWVKIMVVTGGNSNWKAKVIQGGYTSGIVSLSTNTLIKVPFNAIASGTATLEITNHSSTPLSITISAIHLDTASFVPQNVVSQISSGSLYPYGFNGKIKDNEWAGVGNHIDYGFRGYDPRIARFGSVDPLTKKFPWYTPYQFAGNKPIMATDLDGAEELIVIRWFDQGQYKGETKVQIKDVAQRYSGEHGVQKINLNYSSMKGFFASYRSNNISDAYEYINNGPRQFKGCYSEILSPIDSRALDGIQTDERNNPYKWVEFTIPSIGLGKANFVYDADKMILSERVIDHIKTILEDDPELMITLTGYASPENETNKANYNHCCPTKIMKG